MTEEVVCIYVPDMGFRTNVDQVKNAFKINAIGDVKAVRFNCYAHQYARKGAHVYLTMYANFDFADDVDIEIKPYGHESDAVWDIIKATSDLPIPCSRFQTPPVIDKSEERIEELEEELESAVEQLKKLTIAVVELQKSHYVEMVAVQQDIHQLKLDSRDALQYIEQRAAEAPHGTDASLFQRSTNYLDPKNSHLLEQSRKIIEDINKKKFGI